MVVAPNENIKVVGHSRMLELDGGYKGNVTVTFLVTH